jgi:hypothetical protein
MIKTVIFLSLLAATLASPVDEAPVDSEAIDISSADVDFEAPQLDRTFGALSNLTQQALSQLNLTVLASNATAFITLIQTIVQNEINATLTVLTSLLPAQTATVVVPVRSACNCPSPVRFSPYGYPMAFSPYFKQPVQPAPIPFIPQQPYFVRQPFYPEPSFAGQPQYSREQFPAVDDMSDEEALSQLEAVKQRYAYEDAEGRFLLPSISISSNGQTIQIVKPNLTSAFSSLTSTISSLISTLTNLRLTSGVSTKTVLLTTLGVSVASG